MFRDRFHSEEGDCLKICEDEGCDVTAFQEIDVCVPITIEPYVDLGAAEVECIDEPYIVTSPCRNWNKNGTCRFTIAQKLCVKVPVEFKAAATSGPTAVVCGESSEEDCPGCDCEEELPCCEKPRQGYYIKGKEV
ncbi:MAG: hypothetical protein AAGU76_00315 [Sedimentibacter sp.]|uniref:hypothetical protein n=1 Tax=Sedimentibacter sp. TaxID=1960295 RepID=UPI00315993AA